MLKTALKPKWLLALLLAMTLAGGFVWLSQWQFGRAQTAPPPPASVTETPVPLTSHFGPYRPLMADDADQIVRFEGHFLSDSQVLVTDRVHEDGDGNERAGHWVVAAFVLADPLPDGDEPPADSGAARGEDVVIPVVRGWQEAATQPPPLPRGDLQVTGRLLPTESPVEEPVPDAGGVPVFESLSAAQLLNVWELDSYSGFVVAFEVRNPAGEDAGAAAAGLEDVWVGPQPPGPQINWLNIFYGLEWALFAGFAFFLWTRLVRDDYRNEQRARLAAARAAGGAPAAAPGAGEPRPGEPRPDEPRPGEGTAERRTGVVREAQTTTAQEGDDVSSQNLSTQGRRLGGTDAQIRNAAGWFKIAAYITGVFLLLLVVEMTAKYGFGVELVAGGTLADGSSHTFGFVPVDSYAGGFNVTLAIQIAHGWMYVLYLLCDFRLWMLMRWKFTRFLFIALGGVVPFLSFIVERRVHRSVEEEIEGNPQAVKRY
ncbi:SURF1 family cytochrome oxidase biogenesis protein [Zhihengliuella sp.]|uniref:SURF1 family cytochrome oxidase biogenesis protein n=1 Tax=Zhihengliuella sp. TaxID=1954483 RepID=UPI0028127E19|nr:SURF1 family cytochrome oxidase biogenesis protein [Zhihengliuella sp.]